MACRIDVQVMMHGAAPWRAAGTSLQPLNPPPPFRPSLRLPSPTRLSHFRPPAPSGRFGKWRVARTNEEISGQIQRDVLSSASKRYVPLWGVETPVNGWCWPIQHHLLDLWVGRYVQVLRTKSSGPFHTVSNPPIMGSSSIERRGRTAEVASGETVG